LLVGVVQMRTDESHCQPDDSNEEQESGEMVQEKHFGGYHADPGGDGQNWCGDKAPNYTESRRRLGDPMPGLFTGEKYQHDPYQGKCVVDFGLYELYAAMVHRNDPVKSRAKRESSFAVLVLHARQCVRTYHESPELGLQNCHQSTMKETIGIPKRTSPLHDVITPSL
jgi:hypothetical protein